MYMSIETIARGRQLSGGYCDPLSLLKEYRPDVLRFLTEEEQDILHYCCDFESIVFYVDEETEHVYSVDCITDDVLGDDTMAEFLSYSIRWAREQN